MVLGIFRNNPNAFSQNNVNALIKNKKLKLPSVDYFDDHTHIEAREVLRDQNIEWNTKTKKIKKPKKVKKVSNKDAIKIEQLEKELLETKNKLKGITGINKTKKLEPILDSESALTDNNKASKKDQSLKKKVEEKEKIITQEKLDEKNDGVFISSISDIDEDKIEETEIDIQANKGLETIHILLLILFFILLFGLFVVTSRRKANERNYKLRNFNNDSENDKATDSYSDTNNTNQSQQTDVNELDNQSGIDNESNKDDKKF